MKQISQILNKMPESQRQESARLQIIRPSQTISLNQNPLTVRTVVKALAILTTHFAGLELTEDKISLWHEAVKDLTEQEFVKGIKLFCLKHLEIYPNTNVIAHIRKYAKFNPEVLSPEEAWGDVVRALRRNSPVFSTSAISKAVEIIGWRNLCESSRPEMDRAHFCKTYEAILKREEMREICGGIS